MAEEPKFLKDTDPIGMDIQRQKRAALAEALKRTVMEGSTPDMLSRFMGFKAKPPVGYSGIAPYSGPQAVDEYGQDQAYGMPWEAYQTGKTRATQAQHMPVHRLPGGVIDDLMLKEDRRPASAPDGTPLPTPNHPKWDGLEEDEGAMYDTMVSQGLYNANKSALASLGLRDMTKFNIDPREDAARLMPYGGSYLSHLAPDGTMNFPAGYRQTEDGTIKSEGGDEIPMVPFDRGYVNRRSDSMSTEGMQHGSSLPHEGMHRGLEVLRNTGKYAQAARRLMPKEAPAGAEEPVVRTLMTNLVGKEMTEWDEKKGAVADDDFRELIIKAHDDPKSVGLTKTDSGAWTYKPHYSHDYNTRKAALEFLAAELIKDTQPGGPR